MLDFLRSTPEVAYLALLFCLFVVPRILQRFRIPTGITSFALGAFSAMSVGLFSGDDTVGLLATFGIVSLFLLAGIDIDFGDLRREARVLFLHVVSQASTLAVSAFALEHVLGIGWRAATLTALALLTPSTGFILDSLDGFRASERERFWIRSKAIATEIVALGVLFFTLQSTTSSNLLVSSAALLAMIAVLPLAFRAFARFIVPHAPKSEFAFLLMVAVLCAFVTRKLGVYYLVGAFVVGMAAQRFREKLPALASEKMLHAVEAFASVFVPFYFFNAGLALRREDFGWPALLAGACFVAVFLPLRFGVVAVHLRLNLGEGLRDSLRINLQMLPTLVLTLVIAQILRDRFEIPGYLYGGLIVYTIVNTMLPGFVLRTPPADFTAPRVGALEADTVPEYGGFPAARREDFGGGS